MKLFRWPTLATILFATVSVQWPSDLVGAEVFALRSNLHGSTITGHASAAIAHGAYTMSLAAQPGGALLNEIHGQGLGVNSAGIPGAVDSGDAASIDKFNVLTGPLVPPGTTESVSFSFNRAGVIRDLLFDGLKDETLEYMKLRLPSGDELTFFDLEAGGRLAAQGFSLAGLPVPNPTLLNGLEDDYLGINLPFQAGDTFVLSYGEAPFPVGYAPLTGDQPPNGARWHGIVVVPEPAAASLGGLAVLAFAASARFARARKLCGKLRRTNRTPRTASLPLR
jgi:hypothetical protein